MRKITLFFIFLFAFAIMASNSAKADTIHYQLPHATEYLCVDTTNMPVFIFYQPNGFDGSVWRVNGQYQVTEDSLVFVPTIIGSYTITAKYGANVEGMIIRLYAEVPPSPDLEVSNGGVINSTGDTAWMCGESVTIRANNVFDSESTSIYWSGPNEFSYDAATITVSTPGTYYFTRTNPCGTTVDSIEVVSLPNELPIIEDVLKCNEELNETLDAGPGWTSYQWTMGSETETTQSVVVTPSLLGEDGTLTVYLNVSNQCVSSLKDTIIVEQQIFPEPDLNQYSTNIGFYVCQDVVANLVPHASYTYDTYTWTHNMDPTCIEYNSILNVDYDMGSGHYYVNVTKGSCPSTDFTVVMFYPNPVDPDICVVTYDPVVGKNKAVAMHNGDQTEYFVLAYKQGSNWINVDSVYVTGPGAYESHELYDMISDPNQQSKTYTIFARHECGHVSELTDWHKTIRVGILQDMMSQNYFLQILDDYETMSDYEPDSYTIWVQEAGQDPVEVGILDGGNSSFTISNPINGGLYFASVNLPWNCDNLKSGTIAFSNRMLFSTTQTYPLANIPQFEIYPNPSDGIFQIDGQVFSVKVFDNLGRLVYCTKNTNIIDLTSFELGVYHAEIQTVANGPATKVKLSLLR